MLSDLLLWIICSFLAKKEQERALFQKRVSPEIDYINAKREYDDAQTRANELNSLISSYGGSGNGTIEVRAAMSGTVLQVLAAVGSKCNTSFTTL